MGYVFSYQDAIAYQRDLNDPKHKYRADLQSRLMVDMLKPAQGQSVLGIGCGTGMHLSRLNQMGLQVTGLDPSPYMLDIVKKNLGDRVDLHRGFAEDLPFDDNSFDLVCMIFTLEFVDNPVKAIEEACRVGKDVFFLTVLNRYGIMGPVLWARGKRDNSLYAHARPQSLWGLIRTIRNTVGDVPLYWETLSRLPGDSGRIARRIRAGGFMKWWPFGDSIAAAVVLEPRFRTRPLTVAYSPKP